MLTLFHAPHSRSSRIVWLIEELGAEVDIRYVDIQRADGSGGRDAANPHPDSKVPALKHGDALITESAAVALYLTGLHPQAGLGFPLESPERGPLLSWICWNAGELEPSLWAKMSGEVETNPHARARYDAAITRVLEALWVGPYLMGDRFTAADVMIGSTLGWARAHLPESPVLDAYLERLQSRPASLRAMQRDARPAIAA